MAYGSRSRTELMQDYDVLVVGGGNAALCAAMVAREAGATVLVLESSPKDFRGGNSRHTRNIRYFHDRASNWVTGPYLEDEFYDDLLRVTGGQTNEELARLTVRESFNVVDWMEEHGCKFQPPLSGTLHLTRTNGFFFGGGTALMNGYFDTAAKMGIVVAYNAEARDLKISDGKFSSAVVMADGDFYEVQAKTVVVASGGFQANIAWLKEYWGEPADNFLIRGTPYDKGVMLRVLLDNGVKPVGDPTQCHAVAIDARAPKFDGGIVTRLDCIPFGIVVNKDAKRFYDEGEDIWPKRYAIWGRLVAGQPDQVAYVVLDSPTLEKFMPSVFPPVKADTLRGLAAEFELDPDVLEETVAAYNQATQPGESDPSKLDGLATEGVEPAKTNWALPIGTPPFYGYPLRPGITFTYYGIAVDEKAHVLMQDDQPSPNIFSAGEIMSGNVLGQGYMAGFGMTVGTVFGKIAGEEAARYAIN